MMYTGVNRPAQGFYSYVLFSKFFYIDNATACVSNYLYSLKVIKLIFLIPCVDWDYYCPNQ